MLHIKLKGMARTTTCNQPFCPYTQTRPLGWGQNVKTLFSSENGRVVYQIKGNKKCDNLQSNDLTLHTLDLWDGVNFFSSESGRAAHEFRGKLVMHIPWSFLP